MVEQERCEKEVYAIDTLLWNQVAGILISHSIETSDTSHLCKALNSNVRLVQFDRVFYNIPDVKVVNDNYHGAYTATKHLIDNGYTRIGTLAGYMTSAQYRERLEGYKRALQDAGMAVDESLIFENTILRETGYERAKEALDLGCDAMNNIIGALQNMGVKVPEGLQKAMNVMQSLISAIQSVQTIVQMFATSSQAANTAAVTANTGALVAMQGA